MRRGTDVGRAGVEALELRIEVLVAEEDQRLGEGLVEGVVAEDPRVRPEGARHVAPHAVVLALQVAPDVVGPEVAEGDAGRLGGVLERPAPGDVHARHAVRAHGPRRGALAVEHLVVHVLVHVQDDVDVEPPQQVHGRPQPLHVAVEDGLVELVGVRRVARSADGGVVGLGGPRLEAAPGHAQAHHVEAQACHERGVGRREIPRLARSGEELVRRVLVDGVDAVEEDDAPLAVVEVGPARRRVGAGGCRRAAQAGTGVGRRLQRRQGGGGRGRPGRPAIRHGPDGEGRCDQQHDGHESEQSTSHGRQSGRGPAPSGHAPCP